MAFDQSTRNRLQKFVSDARGLLSEEFTRQLQNDFGLDPHSGTVTPLENLGHLDDTRRETARILRETLAHYLASSPSGGAREALDRIVREQAFTVLNRLAALRMAESRGILIESVGNGYQSKGFQLYERLAGSGLGETGDTYRCYLFSIFDEFALDLKVLFDRFSPQGRLFPRETALLELLGLLNDQELAHLWAEDESVGWVYQYFNSKEERKKMRDESAAPRNSRELAVRNQFFTPRYVVEFLTDNTLGRIWYEMTQGETGLKDSCRYLVRRPVEIFLKAGEKAPEQAGADENLSQEDLLKQPVHIQHRPLKDPRTLRMLDPACGSMHFGLYAFDLYEQIYDEAWELEQRLGSKAFACEDGLKPLTESYPDKEAFLQDVPRLIIEHNIHGIDIDPRAAQIAGLSLWLRAQRSWHNQGMKPAVRPRITRSNIVCAEPMPGEKELLREFTARLEVPALGYLVEQVFYKMQLAGEAGSLLKIEEEIRDIIAEAKRQWKAGPKLTQMGLFGEAPAKPEQVDLPLDFTGITDERFWEGAEEKLYQALQEYAEVAGEHGFQRRLFAEDAARGFAFIDVCRKSYDVAVMNPPFGLAPRRVFEIHKKKYADSYVEMYAQMVTRGTEILNSDGCLGAISSRSFMTISRLRQYRRKTILPGVLLLADLGASVMDDAFVESTAYIVSKRSTQQILAIDLRGIQEPQARLASNIASLGNDNSNWVIKDRQLIAGLPDGKLLYSLPIRVHKLLENENLLEPAIATVRQGMGTFNDFRFLRLRQEVPVSSVHMNGWEPLAKGGAFSFYYSDIYLLLNWKDNGAELSALNIAQNGQDAQVRQASDYWRRSGSTYSKRSQKGFSARALPSGCIIAGKGPAILSQSDVSATYLLGWVNSLFIRWIIELQANDHEYNTGILKKIPWIEPVEGSRELTARTIDSILRLQYGRAIDETNSWFVPFLSGDSIQLTIDNWNIIDRDAQDTLSSVMAAWDEYIDRLYNVDSKKLHFNDSDDDSTELAEDEENDAIVGGCHSAGDIISILVGMPFGRWDVRFATGEKPKFKLTDPFAALPACPPGMLQSTQCLPAEPQDVPTDYPLRISWPGILVDDEGHKEDIAGRAREAIEVIWKEKAGDIEHEACEILGVRTLRDYFSKPSGFFADHLKRYSKSRRQAPIYWPLSTPSGSYTLWLYYHRLNDQTLYTCVNDFVEPKLTDVAAELASLRQKGSGRTREDEKRLEKLQDLEIELQEFRDELLRLARLPWKPNLNDGVQITAAPLWKLFQLPKWKKTLKETWEKLEKGEYDWAHLAYSIWPDRVKKKCVTDKSLAIAHDLEDLYVEPLASAKKKRGKKGAVVEDEEE